MPIFLAPNGKIDSLTRGNGGVFDQNLNPRQLTSFIGSTYGDDFNYSYDANGRVTNINAVANNSFDRNLTYDGAGRLETASGPWGSGTYVYDPLGNIESKTLGSRLVDIDYTTTNRVDRVKDTTVSSSWRYYSHDARGNVTSDGIHTFTYDYANQPSSITGADSGSYAYDGHLRRVKQIVNGETIYSIYDASGTLLTRDNATTNEETDYLAVAGQTFVRLKNGVATYPINDHLGTASMVANQTGSILSGHTFNYTPFGESWGTNDPGNANQQGYTGHIEDETGLTYMQARYYDPIMGRFLSTDPIGYEDQLNLYAYVGNDPVNAFDPTGLETEVTLKAYPIVRFPTKYGHAFLHYRDIETSETRISRAGPSMKYPGGSSAAIGDRAYTSVTVEAIDTPAIFSVDYNVGDTIDIATSTIDANIGEIQSQLVSFNEEVNAAGAEYRPRSQNSNTYAGDAYELVTGQAPKNNSSINLPGLKNSIDTSAGKNSANGMSSGKVEICSGMGAQKDSC